MSRNRKITPNVEVPNEDQPDTIVEKLKNFSVNFMVFLTIATPVSLIVYFAFFYNTSRRSNSSGGGFSFSG